MFIYSEQAIRSADQKVVETGIDIFTLMENAGRALYEEVSTRITKQKKILIVAGKGNNGGDGIVLARYLKQNGYQVDLVFPVGEPTSSTAKEHLEVYQALGYSVENEIGQYDVIVDALLGIGVKLPLRDDVLNIVRWANEQDAFRIAIDLPTGVLADRGTTEVAFCADLTLCLHGYKPSAFLHPSIDFYGEKKAVDIGIPHVEGWKIWSGEDVRRTYPQRQLNAHKGTFGTGLLAAGSDEMPGSAMLSGIGCMRSGIGKLVIATTPFAVSIICAKLPEATYLHNGLEKIAEGYLPEKIKVAAIGPGLIDLPLTKKAVDTLLSLDIPLILDASALVARNYPRRDAPIIVTPHPGEFSKMTGKSIDSIQANRLVFASDYSKEQGVIVVLKGRNTVIAFPDGSGLVNATGNSALAKGGTGDTLTGMLLAMLCTHENIHDAVANAVYLHGKCAEYWTDTYSEESFLASDFHELLPIVTNKINQP